jgi:hypothetical protein
MIAFETLCDQNATAQIFCRPELYELPMLVRYPPRLRGSANQRTGQVAPEWGWHF